MIFGGLQKNSLIDYPGKISCVLFATGCNFSCPYCHNPQLARGCRDDATVFDEKTAYDFLERRKGFLEGVVISGGEPTLQKDLPAVCEKIKEMGYPVKLDTNGSRPQVLKRLLDDALVDYVAMDIKTDPANYNPLIQKDFNPSPLLESIQQTHALRQERHSESALPDAWFHWFDFFPYLAELNDFLVQYGGWLAAHDPEGADLQERLVCLVDRCTRALSTTTADPRRGRFPLRLCRVDPNLANAIWGRDGSIRWVDWEYGGWGDPALDLADMRWHIALEGVSEAQHARIRSKYVRPDDDPGFEQRLAAWDRLLLTRWPFLILRALWSAHNGPDRVRLTRPEVSPTALRARLVRTIERAERFRVS